MQLVVVEQPNKQTTIKQNKKTNEEERNKSRLTPDVLYIISVY